eukprot:TRINITY_DN1476_c0_g1_i1.p1 TRINITY_DN1476_c0_g1~~TRINITY_DN1476_c0_g1_i1.p1  ORF type:complete len:133 (+),score=14.71 TRINITY_DN1476_c0_g1_i1:502-900(+)
MSEQLSVAPATTTPSVPSAPPTWMAPSATVVSLSAAARTASIGIAESLAPVCAAASITVQTRVPAAVVLHASDPTAPVIPPTTSGLSRALHCHQRAAHGIGICYRASPCKRNPHNISHGVCFSGACKHGVVN